MVKKHGLVGFFIFSSLMVTLPIVLDFPWSLKEPLRCHFLFEVVNTFKVYSEIGINNRSGVTAQDNAHSFFDRQHLLHFIA